MTVYKKEILKLLLHCLKFERHEFDIDSLKAELLTLSAVISSPEEQEIINFLLNIEGDLETILFTKNTEDHTYLLMQLVEKIKQKCLYVLTGFEGVKSVDFLSSLAGIIAFVKMLDSEWVCCPVCNGVWKNEFADSQLLECPGCYEILGIPDKP